MALFESYERRIEKINSVLSQYGISSVEECREYLPMWRSASNSTHGSADFTTKPRSSILPKWWRV